MDEPGDLVLIASVPLEVEPVLQRLHDMRRTTIGRKPAAEGTLAGRHVVVIEGGMGKVNAAQALTAALERGRVGGIVAFGVGGAYPGSGLEVGGLALASAEIYGDEGVDAPGSWLSSADIGIPLLHGEEGPVYNEIPLSPARLATASGALTDSGLAHGVGPFVTVSACSGTARRGEELRRRHAALVESMEGAAYAHVAALYAVPCVEVRGISNAVEDRDLTRWRLEAAAAVAARAVEHVVAHW